MINLPLNNCLHWHSFAVFFSPPLFFSILCKLCVNFEPCERFYSLGHPSRTLDGLVGASCPFQKFLKLCLCPFQHYCFKKNLSLSFLGGKT
jgi:hypothetical protein